MKINDIVLSDLSRDEYINLIVILINSFKLDYNTFSEKEKSWIRYNLRSVVCCRRDRI